MTPEKELIVQKSIDEWGKEYNRKMKYLILMDRISMYNITSIRNMSFYAVLGIVTASLLIISCFIPYIYVGFEDALELGKSVTFIDTDFGIPLLIFAAAAIVFSLFLIKWGMIISGIGSMVCFVLQVVISCRRFSAFLGDFGNLKDFLKELLNELIELKIGFYAIPVLSVVLIICGIMMKDASNNRPWNVKSA